MELVVCQGGGFHDLLVAELVGADTGGQVGDAGDAQAPDAALGGHDGLGDGGHTHGIGTENARHADLGRGLVAGAGEHHVNALAQDDARLHGGQLDLQPQIGAVQVGDIGEADTEGLFVDADEGVGAGVVDVVGFAFGFFFVVLFLAFCAFCGFCISYCLDWLYRLIKFYVKNHPKKDKEAS